MSFHTGTITTSSTPAADLIALAHTHITAHPAWSHVKDVTISSVVHRVYRCSGAYNAHGSDFHVALYGSTSTNLGMKVFEEFDTGTDQYTNPVQTAAGFSRAVASDGALSGVGVSWTLDASPAALGAEVLVTGTIATVWAVGITNNTLVIAVQGATANHGALIAQVYEEFEELSQFPLVFLRAPLNGAVVQGGYSRQPMRESAAGDTNHFLEDPLALHDTGRRFAPLVGTLGGAVDLFYDAVLGCRIAVLQRGALQTYGKVRGVYRDLALILTPGGVEVGDTVDIRGREFAYVSWQTWFDTDAP